MFRRNVIANYLGQGYIAAVGILIVPFYLEFLGNEGYGLVGIFTMLQAWLQILDMGISTTLSREAAKARINDANALFFKKLKFLVVVAFVVIGSLLFLTMLGTQNYIVEQWLDTKLSDEIIRLSLLAIILSVSLRWCSAPWRSTLVGLEKQVILNITQVIITTLRFPCSLLVMYFSDEKITAFFKYQAVLAVIELVTYFILSNKFSPKAEGSIFPDKVFLSSAKSTFKFALAVGFTSTVWVLVTQLDKLLLSSLISLEDYGYFSVAVIAAGGISMLSMPIAQAITPRLTHLFELGDHSGLKEQYSNTTMLVGAIVIPAALMLGTFAEEVLFLWTQKEDVVEGASEILRWYAWGNGLLALSAFPYYLQYANGNLKLHILGNLIFVVFLIPSIYFATKLYGAVGAAKVWFFQNLFYFVCWTWVVHSKFLRNYHWIWLRNKILPFSLAPSLVVGCVSQIAIATSIVPQFIFLSVTSAVTIAANLYILKLIRR